MTISAHHVEQWTMNGDWTSYIKMYDVSEGTYEEYSSPSIMIPIPAWLGVGDIIYIGSEFPWSIYTGLRIVMGTLSVHSGITVTWEFYNGSAWTEFTDLRDDTDLFQQNGDILWDITKNRPWREATVNGTARNWIRFTVDTFGSISTAGYIDCNNSYHLSETIKCVSEGAVSFSDLYDEDVAGTFDLFVGAAAASITPTFEVRPAEMGSLKVDIDLSGCGSGAGDTIDVTGTDSEGNAESESIDVSGGDATYTTSKSYKTISDIACNGFSGGTLTVTQNRWGVVHKILDSVYVFDRAIELRSSTFTDSLKNVSWNHWLFAQRYSQASMIYFRDSITTLGAVYNAPDKNAQEACFLWLHNIGSSHYQVGLYGESNDVDELYLYNVAIASSDIGDTTMNVTGATAARMWCCFFPHQAQLMLGQNNNADLNYILVGEVSSIVRRADATTSVQNVYGAAVSRLIWFQTYGGTVRDVVGTIRFGGEIARMESTGTEDAYMIDCVPLGTYATWDIDWTGGGTGKLYRQYSVNLEIVDKDGGAIEGATVTLRNNADVQVFSVATAADGTITEQIVSHSYSDSSNALEEDHIQYGPFELEISAPGHKTILMKIDLDTKVDWIVTLEDRFFTTLDGHQIELLSGQMARRIS